jgi:uncharacterized phiE125 gp8 family phage protein
MTLCPVRLSIAPLEASPLPVDLDLLKSHCAIDGTEFDALLTTYLFGAVAWAENAMHRTIFARTHRWVLRSFPLDGSQEIRLPRGKTQSIESIQYSVNGSTVTLTGPSSGSPAGTGYQEDLSGDDGGVLMPVRGSSWPSADEDAVAPVVVNFTAGWSAAEVPSDILHALLFAVSDAYEMRGEADVASVGRNLTVREILISAYRLHRWY